MTVLVTIQHKFTVVSVGIRYKSYQYLDCTLGVNRTKHEKENLGMCDLLSLAFKQWHPFIVNHADPTSRTLFLEALYSILHYWFKK